MTNSKAAGGKNGTVRRRRSAGQAILELALVLPILLLVLLGTVELGRLFYTALVLQHATYEGVRLAAVAGTDSAVAHRVANLAAGAVANAELYTTRIGFVDGRPALHVVLSDDGQGPRADAWVVPVGERREPGGDVLVRIRYDLPLLLPLPGSVFPNPFPLQVESRGRVEVPPS